MYTALLGVPAEEKIRQYHLVLSGDKVEAKKTCPFIGCKRLIHPNNCAKHLKAKHNEVSKKIYCLQERQSVSIGKMYRITDFFIKNDFLILTIRKVMELIKQCGAYKPSELYEYHELQQDDFICYLVSV